MACRRGVKVASAKEEEGETVRHLLMVHRQASDECEAAAIVVYTDDPRVVVIELDDGVRLECKKPRESACRLPKLLRTGH
jgi:hypothetical protein